MKTILQIAFVTIAALISTIASAQLRLPAMYGNNMVLQQQAKVTIWGWASPREEISVTGNWDNQEIKATTLASNSQWKVVLNTPKAGGPYTVLIKGAYSKINLDNVLIGEVWLCSGQSNMQWQPSAGIDHGEEEITKANHPEIRLFNVQRIGADYPQQNCFGEWTVCNPENMKNFSAIGYFFGKKLQENLNVPIGLINASWGGSPIEIWMREELFNTDENLRKDASSRVAEWAPTKPGAAYNTMIYPFLSFPIAGAIWYQGESNVDHTQTYSLLMKKLIDSWHEDWKLDFPFYYVQIAPCHYKGGNYQAALIREQQTKALQNPKTGMVVITDLVADTSNIHPKDKIDVGYRLANLALSETYGKTSIMAKSPVFKSMSTGKGKVKLLFENVNQGFKINGKDITGFLLAGDDRKFYPAKAKIDKNAIILTCKEVKTPVAVRFGFFNTATPNLFNTEGLPVCPFRTDDWEVR